MHCFCAFLIFYKNQGKYVRVRVHVSPSSVGHCHSFPVVLPVLF